MVRYILLLVFVMQVPFLSATNDSEDSLDSEIMVDRQATSKIKFLEHEAVKITLAAFGVAGAVVLTYVGAKTLADMNAKKTVFKANDKDPKKAKKSGSLMSMSTIYDYEGQKFIIEGSPWKPKDAKLIRING